MAARSLDARLLSALAPMTPAQWLSYVARSALAPSVRRTGEWLGGRLRTAAWWTALALLALTALVVGRRPPEAPPGSIPEAAPPPPPDDVRTSVLPGGVVVRDKRKRPRPLAVPPTEPRAAARVVPPPARRQRAGRLLCTAWTALVGALLVAAERRSVPRAVTRIELGRQVCGDPVRRAVVIDRAPSSVRLDDVLVLATDEGADWRMAATFWINTHVGAAARAQLVGRELVGVRPTDIADRRLTVLLRVAAETASALPDADARELLRTALVLQGQMYGRASLTCDDASPVFPATRHFSSI